MIFVVLPAYNEAAALRELLPEIAKTLNSSQGTYTVCLVDDGSRDGTTAVASALAQQIPLQYLHHEKNRGYGAAVKTGVVWVAQHGLKEDVLITMDADNTHPPDCIPKLINKLQEGHDVVTASYTLPGGQAMGVPYKRRILSRVANTLLRLRFRVPGIGTYTNGFRAYRVGILQKAFHQYGDRLIQEHDFAGGTELFIKAIRCGARAGEIPFILHYENRGTGSKIHILNTIAGYLKLLLH